MVRRREEEEKKKEQEEEDNEDDDDDDDDDEDDYNYDEDVVNIHEGATSKGLKVERLTFGQLPTITPTKTVGYFGESFTIERPKSSLRDPSTLSLKAREMEGQRDSRV
uniref:Uncharacterized protein n=1 Tax=Vespula pensylvanica TaxID=30213 RepID=A0A834PFH3_VESPE|nr:hypothetical protein H0235_000597 [Vespula pensylvanica]